jgi:AcrR family transcriptional regulator
MSTTGLRERKKAATKAALSQAAVSLMLERGLDGVRGDAIAAAVGVAPRTFRNYFANKEEAVLFAMETVQNRYVETFMGRDPNEPVLDSLEAAAIAVVEAAGYREHLAAATRLIAQDRALVAHRAASRNAASATLVERVAARTGTDPHDDLYPQLVCRAAEAVMQSVVEMYVSRPAPSSELVRRVREGFDQLRQGLDREPRVARDSGTAVSRPTRGQSHRPPRRARRSRKKE